MLQAIRNRASSLGLGGKPSSGLAIPPQASGVDATSSLPSRVVEQVLQEEHAIEGPGFEITRPFPTRKMRMFDPWLLFDAFGPKVVKAGDPSTVRSSHLGQHPHRGFEAVTYMIEGSHDHFDSTGKYGRLSPGSVQLMTAGAGIVHGGAPTPEMQKGGKLHGYQIWLALPASKRMCPASTTDLHASQTPTITSADGLAWARVLASSTPVLNSPAATCDLLPTALPVMIVHFILQPGAVVRQPVPAGFSAMVHVSVGEGRFGPGLATAARAEQAVLFGRDELAQGDSLVEFGCPVEAAGPLDVMLLAGQPTGETIVQYGPFVGGSMADISSARTDFNAGLMGGLAPDGSAAPRSIWAA